MRIRNDEILIKREEYLNLLIENAKLREQASPFYKYSINEIRQYFGLSKILEEEKKIPEKLNIYNYDENDIMCKVNEIIDYLESKGE